MSQSTALPTEPALPKKPPARTVKPSLPTSPADTAALTNATQKPAKKDKAQILIIVPHEFQKEFKGWTHDHDMTFREALYEGFKLLQEKYR